MRLDFSGQKDQRIMIQSKDKISFLAIDRIIYMECDGYITTVYTDESKPVVVCKLLKAFEEELQVYGFKRANRSVLVNMAWVKQYIGGNVRLLEMLSGEKFKVSRRRETTLRVG